MVRPENPTLDEGGCPERFGCRHIGGHLSAKHRLGEQPIAPSNDDRTTRNFTSVVVGKLFNTQLRQCRVDRDGGFRFVSHPCRHRSRDDAHKNFLTGLADVRLSDGQSA